MVKKTRIIFKNGVVMDVIYSNKAFKEMSDNLGKDHKCEFPTYTLNTKNVDAIFFIKEEKEEEEAK